MRGRTLLLRCPFCTYAAPRQILSQHALPSGSMVKSGTDQGLTVENQPRLFNGISKHLLSFQHPTVRPLPADIDFDNAYTLRDIAVKSWCTINFSAPVMLRINIIEVSYIDDG